MIRSLWSAIISARASMFWVKASLTLETSLLTRSSNRCNRRKRTKGNWQISLAWSALKSGSRVRRWRVARLVARSRRRMPIRVRRTSKRKPNSLHACIFHRTSSTWSPSMTSMSSAILPSTVLSLTLYAPIRGSTTIWRWIGNSIAASKRSQIDALKPCVLKICLLSRKLKSIT